MKLMLALLTFLAVSLMATATGQDLAKSAGNPESIVIADNFLIGISAPPVQQHCTVQSNAPSSICECGSNKVKVSDPCIFCSTAGGQKCGEKKCKSCYVVCAPAGSVPPQNLACN